MLDGKLIASRNAGFLTKLLGGGWPDEEAVVAEVKKHKAAVAVS